MCNPTYTVAEKYSKMNSNFKIFTEQREMNTVDVQHVHLFSDDKLQIDLFVFLFVHLFCLFVPFRDFGFIIFSFSLSTHFVLFI